jgi:hypothetical protein
VWQEGERATRSQVEAAVQHGLAQLQKLAEADGAKAVRLLAKQHAELLPLLPKTPLLEK